MITPSTFITEFDAEIVKRGGMSKRKASQAARNRQYEETKRVRYAFGGGSIINIGWNYRQQIADIRKNARTRTNFPVKFHQMDLRWSDRGRVWDSKEPEFVKAVPMPETLEHYLKRHQ